MDGTRLAATNPKTIAKIPQPAASEYMALCAFMVCVSGTHTERERAKTATAFETNETGC